MAVWAFTQAVGRAFVAIYPYSLLGGVLFLHASRHSGVKAKKARLRASLDELAVDDVGIWPRSEIAEWQYTRYAGKLGVRLVDARARTIVDVIVRTKRRLRLLRALGLDATRVRTLFHLASPLQRSALGALLVVPLAYVMWLATVAASAGSMPHALASLAIFVLLGLLVWPARMLVGTDGLRYDWLFWRRFYSFRDVVAVERTDRGIRLRRTGKRPSFITVLSLGSANRPTLELAYETVESAWSSRGEDNQRRRLVDSLARQGRSVQEWTDTLGERDQLEASYRLSATSDEHLWNVLEDAKCDPTARVGAAYCLRQGGRANRRRLRIAAHSVAERKVRVALEALSDAEPDDLTGALAHVAE